MGAEFAGSACGYNSPAASTITHGLSVGWDDTYPASLPDQGIDITRFGRLPGTVTMKVKITADGENFVKESDEGNNSATATVKLEGNRVVSVQVADGA